jgi:hypothetical protein
VWVFRGGGAAGGDIACWRNRVRRPAGDAHRPALERPGVLPSPLVKQESRKPAHHRSRGGGAPMLDMVQRSIPVPACARPTTARCRRPRGEPPHGRHRVPAGRSGWHVAPSGTRRECLSGSSGCEGHYGPANPSRQGQGGRGSGPSAEVAQHLSHATPSTHKGPSRDANNLIVRSLSEA